MPRRILKGVVVQSKMHKTARVSVMRSYVHPVYGKIVRRKKFYSVHDPENVCKISDNVMIQECAPVSKTKTFEVLSVVEG